MPRNEHLPIYVAPLARCLEQTVRGFPRYSPLRRLKFGLVDRERLDFMPVTARIGLEDGSKS